MLFWFLGQLGASSNFMRTSRSMQSAPSTRSASPNSRLQMDTHKQLKETDRPADEGNSSDPDTSLFEYEDDA